jgi:hypothetical protein
MEATRRARIRNWPARTALLAPRPSLPVRTSVARTSPESHRAMLASGMEDGLQDALDLLELEAVALDV